jgi:hypothetical protein
MRTKIILTAIMAPLLCLGLSGCGGDGSSSVVTPPTPQITRYNGAAEIVVNTQVSTDWSLSKPITLANGNTLVSWLQGSALGTVQGQMYDATGAKIGGVITLTSAGIEAQIAPLSTGGFVAFWDASNNMAGQVFDANGAKVGAEFIAPTYATYKSWATIAGLADGKFIIGWVDIIGVDGNADGYDLNAQIFDSTGVKMGSKFRINSNIVGNQELPNFTSLNNGGFVATWCNNCNSSSSTASTISAQMFDANGNKTGAQIDVSTDALSININSRVAALKNGGFAVTWEELKNFTGSSGESKAKLQIFNASGAKVGSAINVSDTGNQAVSDIAGLKNGQVAVLWQEGLFPIYPARLKDLKVQVFSDTGVKQADAYTINLATPAGQYTFWPSIGALSNSGFVVSWKEYNGNAGQVNGYPLYPDWIETTKARFYSFQ